MLCTVICVHQCLRAQIMLSLSLFHWKLSFGEEIRKAKIIKGNYIQLDRRFSINEEEVLSSRSHGGFTQHALLVLKGPHHPESKDELFTFFCRMHGL